MEHSELPEGDRIYDLYTGVYKPQIIRNALMIDVFSPLDGGPADYETVARACQCDAVGIQRLLDYLSCLKVLNKQADKYSLSPSASVFLVRGKKTYAGDLVTQFTGPEPWLSVQESIRKGQPHSIDQEIHFAQDAWIESYRQARIPSSLEMWASVGIFPEKSSCLRLLDIACGCAIKSLVLAQKSPGMQVTCLDTPLVLESARDLAERWGVSSQVSFLADNLLSAELGEAHYDTCLLGQITHYLTEGQNRDLFDRIFQALVPGGKLVLDVPMETGQLSESSTFLSLVLWANSGGRAYSFEVYRLWLEASGFVTVDQVSERLLSALR
jgi:SAM-dependent methyltransferase